MSKTLRHTIKLEVIVLLPEFAEVGVRFCKPGKRQYHSAKHDTKDSDISSSVNQRLIDRLTLTAAPSNDGTRRRGTT